MNPIEQTALAQQNIYRQGMASSPDARRLKAILLIWDRVKDDPQAKIPTALACAIEAARTA